jgi:protein-S-isoprenylcysteine O-methyltransferase Ste14
MPVAAYLKAGLFVVAAAAALFAAAGTVAIPGFWAYLAIFAVVMIVSFAALDPDLLRERMRPGGKKPPLALRVFSLVLFMHWIVAGLDRGRFHWSDNVPDWLQGVCLFTFAAGYALALWAMRVNRFFSSAIRIQTDRGQHVVTTGPYAFVRHPGYTAGILIIAASGPALGSWLAAALVVIFSLPFLLYRTISEDQILQVGLAGYFGLRRAGPMAAHPGDLVRAKPHLGKHAPHQTGPLPSRRGSKRAMSESVQMLWGERRGHGTIGAIQWLPMELPHVATSSF